MSQLSIAEKRELVFLLEEKLKRKARTSFIDFVKYTMPTYEVNWHHLALSSILEDVAYGRMKNVMVFMPPRMGKSQLVSRHFPAFLMGLYPKARIISTSYSADLASMMNRDVQRIIDSPEYQELFPETRLSGSNIRTVSGNWLRNNDVFEIVDHGGIYRCAGVGGGITGAGAGNGGCIIIDDPIKNQAEADSPTYRNKVWDWFTSTLFTRREKDCPMVVVMTRWHEDDLSSRLLRHEQEAKKLGKPSLDWKVITLPMILEKDPGPYDIRKKGEVLWPSKFNYDEVQVMKTVTSQNEGARVWNALYQQEPVAAEGSIIKRQWLTRFYKERPVRFDEMIQSWDLTFKGGENADFVVGGVWGRIKADKYLLDVVRFQGTFTETIAAIKSLSAKWPKAFLKLIEAKANGEAVMDSLKRELSGIVGYSPDQSKEARVVAVSPEFEAGNIVLPDPSIAPWVHDYINELTSFPSGRYDDQCFVAGTKIATIHGDVPIEKIKQGDKLISPFGICSVIESKQTGVCSVIERCGLIGTSGHKIITKNGPERLDTTKQEMLIKLSWNIQTRFTVQKMLNSTASFSNSWAARESIISAAQRIERTPKVCTLLFGKKQTAKQFAAALRFIMLMAIHSTIILTTLLKYRASNIIRRSISGLRQCLLICRTFAHWLSNGIDQKRDGRGILKMLDGRKKHQDLLFASNVENSFKPKVLQSIVHGVAKLFCNSRILDCSQSNASSVGKNLRSKTFQNHGTEKIVRADVPQSPGEKKLPVYNLMTTDGVYYANGVLVSNCDMTSQALLRFRENAGTLDKMTRL